MSISRDNPDLWNYICQLEEMIDDMVCPLPIEEDVDFRVTQYALQRIAAGESFNADSLFGQIANKEHANDLRERITDIEEVIADAEMYVRSDLKSAKNTELVKQIFRDQVGKRANDMADEETRMRWVEEGRKRREAHAQYMQTIEGRKPPEEGTEAHVSRAPPMNRQHLLLLGDGLGWLALAGLVRELHAEASIPTSDEDVNQTVGGRLPQPSVLTQRRVHATVEGVFFSQLAEIQRVSDETERLMSEHRAEAERLMSEHRAETQRTYDELERVASEQRAEVQSLERHMSELQARIESVRTESQGAQQSDRLVRARMAEMSRQVDQDLSIARSIGRGHSDRASAQSIYPLRSESPRQNAFQRASRVTQTIGENTEEERAFRIWVAVAIFAEVIRRIPNQQVPFPNESQNREISSPEDDFYS